MGSFKDSTSFSSSKKDERIFSSFYKEFKEQLGDATKASRMYEKIICEFERSNLSQEEFFFQTSNLWFCEKLGTNECSVRYGLRKLLEKEFIKIEKINKKNYIITVLNWPSRYKNKEEI